jgi:hypothetical protein
MILIRVFSSSEKFLSIYCSWQKRTVTNRVKICLIRRMRQKSTVLFCMFGKKAPSNVSRITVSFSVFSEEHLKGQFHEIWEFVNEYTEEEHCFENHR